MCIIGRNHICSASNSYLFYKRNEYAVKVLNRQGRDNFYHTKDEKGSIINFEQRKTTN